MARPLTALVAVALTGLAACAKTPPPPAPTEVRAVFRAELPSDPGDPAWAAAPPFTAALLLQDIVEPRQLTATTPALDVRAMNDGARVAFHLAWPDETVDDRTGPGVFSDACAVQLPPRASAELPAPQMGEAGRPVDITFWTARWQAEVDGRPQDIRALYPHATVDHYPFGAAPLEPGSPTQRAMAARYAPALALGNRMAGPRERPVQDLLAAGPGTLETAAAPRSDGRGARTSGGWAVVLTRPLPADAPAPRRRLQAAFAVWDGARDEVGARKMRTGWVPLTLEGREP